MAKKMTKKEAEYKREIRNLKARIRRLKKQGYDFGEDFQLPKTAQGAKNLRGEKLKKKVEKAMNESLEATQLVKDLFEYIGDKYRENRDAPQAMTAYNSLMAFFNREVTNNGGEESFGKLIIKSKKLKDIRDLIHAAFVDYKELHIVISMLASIIHGEALTIEESRQFDELMESIQSFYEELEEE